MISNYHTASSGPDGEYHYTFGGMEEQAPRQQSRSNDNTAVASKKKKGGRLRRGFGWGRGSKGGSKPTASRGRNTTDNMTVSGESHGGQSLTYSTGSSFQSVGESSASTGFSRMIKVLDAEDHKNTPRSSKRVPPGGAAPSTNQSVASSLNYSDSDASYTRFAGARGGGAGLSQRSMESMDYSTDASDSQLEGSKLIQMLMEDEPTFRTSLANKKRPSSMAPAEQTAEQQTAFDRKVEAARAPVQNNLPRGRNKSRVAPSTEINPTNSASLPRTSSQENSILESQSQGKDPKKSGKKRWACGLETIEESIPPNVKNFLRPFLCGVI